MARLRQAGKEGCSLSCGAEGLCFVLWCHRDEPIRCVGGSSGTGMAQTRLTQGAVYFNPGGTQAFGSQV